MRLPFLVVATLTIFSALLSAEEVESLDPLVTCAIGHIAPDSVEIRFHLSPAPEGTVLLERSENLAIWQRLVSARFIRIASAPEAEDWSLTISASSAGLFYRLGFDHRVPPTDPPSTPPPDLPPAEPPPSEPPTVPPFLDPEVPPG